MEGFEKLRRFALGDVANHMGPNVAEDVMRVIDETEREVDERYVRLPKDANGEYVHVGDVMVYADGNTCPMKVVALVPPAVFLTEDGPRYVDMCRHKPPTVEDVLREFTHAILNQKACYREQNIAEYAAKLQLRED